MADYVDRVITEKKFIPNVVIQIGSDYFSVRQPDSGLSIAAPYDKMVSSVILNPSTIDIKKVSTTIASYSFKLIDKNNIITSLVLGNGLNLIGQPVTIWIGRNRKSSSEELNDFSGYFQLPITKIKRIEHNDNSYTFQSSEDTSQMDRPLFAASSALLNDILAGTTTILMRDSINDFPGVGYVRVEDEIFSYTSKDDLTKTFSGVIRGEFDTTPAAHSANTVCNETEITTDNPLNIILRLLTSLSGGGIYDDLTDGLAIDVSVVDVSAIEALRDSLFLTTEIKLELSNMTSALKFMEAEILQPFNLRFTYGLNAKLTVIALDKATFTPIVDTLNETSMTSYPKWTVDETKIVNKLKISWDYDEATETFLRYSEFVDDDSVTAYGLRAPLTFSFKGIKEDLDGEELIAEYARIVFARFASPVAEVEIKTQINQSLKNIGDKVYLESSKIPSATGDLNFSSDMEIVSRSINYQTQDASFKFAFTSFTKIRSGFIAPSDLILSALSQKLVTIAAGRSAKYRVGWFMRLWNEDTQTYEADAPNEIVALETGQDGILLDSGYLLLADDGTPLGYDQAPSDTIRFADNFATALTTSHRLRFANYDEVEATQKRYCFTSTNGNDFSDLKPTYKVTY